MPTKRNYGLDINHTQVALQGRAISHEIRIEILRLLLNNQSVRNLDLSIRFRVSKSTIHHHIEILKAADLIYLMYENHYYEILIPTHKKKLVKNLIHYKKMSKQSYFD